MTARHFGFTKLLVADLEASAAFYTEVFGLTEHFRVSSEIAGRPIDEIAYEATRPDGGVLVLLRYRDVEQPSAGEVILGFDVDDIDCVCARAAAAGGAVHRGVRAMPEHGVLVAFLTDPEGHLVELVERMADVVA